MSIVLYILGCLGLLLGAVIVIWKVSRKEVTTQIYADNCNVIHMYPDPDDPEYTVGEENYPSWKQEQVN